MSVCCLLSCLCTSALTLMFSLVYLLCTRRSCAAVEFCWLAVKGGVLPCRVLGCFQCSPGCSSVTPVNASDLTVFKAHTLPTAGRPCGFCFPVEWYTDIPDVKKERKKNPVPHYFYTQTSPLSTPNLHPSELSFPSLNTSVSSQINPQIT